jgi:hypothetical protein
MAKVLLYINLIKSLTKRDRRLLLEPGLGLFFSKLQLLPRIILLSHFSLENRYRFMDEEKGQEWGILAQTHNVAANSWGKAGLGNG